MFKDLMLAQLEKAGKYEIEEVTDIKITVWDTDDKKEFDFEFDENGNLIDIY